MTPKLQRISYNLSITGTSDSLVSPHPAKALIREAYKELQPAESAASKQLNLLTPKDTLIFNQELRAPSSDENLYVIIHDSDQVSLSAQVLKETEGIRKRFITACIEKGDTIKLAGFDALL